VRDLSHLSLILQNFVGSFRQMTLSVRYYVGCVLHSQIFQVSMYGCLTKLRLVSICEVNSLYHQTICMEMLTIGGERMTTSWNISGCQTTKLGEFNPTHLYYFSILRVGFLSVEGKQSVI